jgi:serine/threonine protein phosphatase PrpC
VLKVAVAALSNVGCVRTNNEDSFGYDSARNLFVVCDGVGGFASGEIASDLAVSTLLSSFAASEGADAAVEVRLHQAIGAANLAVCEAAQQPQHKGMSTTLVAAVIDGRKLLIGNVGDSRGYMLHNGQCMQITVDHSYRNELVRSGAIAIEDAKNVDLKGMESVITRAIGASPAVEADFFSVELHPGDMVLLASDGLTRYVTCKDIVQMVSAEDLPGSCQTLIESAKTGGGQDNITCMLLHVSSTETICEEIAL